MAKFTYAPIQQKKANRPRQTRYWEYPARDGSPLVALYGSMMAKVARVVKVMLTGIKNIGLNASPLDKLAG
jgi:hypothetical protein